MAGPSSLRSRASRVGFIIVLLLVSLATAAIIAYQAQYSATAQRAAAEGVLRDYSALVSDEVIRRAAVEIGYYGYFELIGGMVADSQRTATPEPYFPDVLPGNSDPRLRHSTSLAAEYFLFDPSKSSLRVEGGAVPAELEAWLQANLAPLAKQHPEGPFQVLNFEADAQFHTFVAARARNSRGAERIIGFEVNLPQLPEWFRAALSRQPLVPTSLGQGKVANDSIRLIIRNRQGAEIFRLGGVPLPELSATKSFGDTYQKMFAGYTVQSSIDPQIASLLVVGGLPAQRVWLFRTLIALDVALILTAIFQLRREAELQRLRDGFVSSVSHELRTPLSQIRMFSETLLLDRVRTSEEARRALEILDAEARRLCQLVENFLRFSRVEKNVDPLSFETLDLALLISQTADDFAPLLKADDSRFVLRLTPGICASIDPGALRQVLLNLFDNAAKYGPKRQRILVELQTRGGAAVVSVEDEGPGIPGADRERVFLRFHRLDRDRRSAIAGTGIGLSVVRDLVVRMNGRCYCEPSQSTGARFVVELPLSRESIGAAVEQSTEALR